MNNQRPLYLLYGGLVIIITALILNHFQVQASTEKALTEAQVSRNLVAARDLKGALERGMGFGKPLALFSGSDKLFDSLKARYDGIEFLAFTSPNLDVYAQTGSPALLGLAPQDIPRFPPINDGKGGGAFRTLIQKDLVLVALPLYFNNTEWKGTVWLGFSRAPIIAQLAVESVYGLALLAVLIGLAGLAFVGFYLFLVRERAETDPETGAMPLDPPVRKRFYLPLLTRISLAIVTALFCSILTYSVVTSGRFTTILVQIYEKNVTVLVGSQAAEWSRIIGWNIPPQRWKGAEALLAAQIVHTPEAAVLALTDAEGRVLYRADRTGTYPNAAGSPADPAVLQPSSEWVTQGLADTEGQVKARLWSRVDPTFLDAILVDRFLDALTVTLVSLIFSIELLLALGLLSRIKPKTALEAPDTEIGIKTIRFTAFLFFMSELLPLPFLPLFITDLYSQSPLSVLQLTPDAVKGLPFSAHLLGVMIFVPVIGALTQRWSLRRLFMTSGLLLMVGNIAASLSPNLEALILFRFLSGLGYGGALAASAALVVQTTAKERRTSGFAAWGAGFAASSICAVILGGILVTHIGYRNGLLVSSAISVVLLLFVVFFHPYKPPVAVESEARKTKFSDLFAPFRDRTALITLLFASIPVQLAFFGLFQFTLPMAMSQSGISEANIGRILTIYGLISLGAPLLARYADRHRNEKLLILAGNVVTGLCLTLFFVQSGLWAMVFVVAAIGVGGLMFDTVISSYLSMTRASETHGEAKFLSIFLTWEKLFTVFIPVLVGTLMTSLGYYESAAVLGIVILAGSLVFWLFGSRKKAS